MHCGKPIENEEEEFCSDCEHKQYHFERGFAVWVYNEAMKNSIAGFKYHNKKEYATFYVREMLRSYDDQLHRLSIDAIIPVPIHKSKYLERGFNQAELLARGIGKELGIPVIRDLLIRGKKTVPQKTLSDKERLRNLSEAFEMKDKPLTVDLTHIKTVLLVDDIYTTGSTIEACTNCLKLHGIKEVYFIVLCIGKGY
jgi:ComF family protein